MPRLDGWVPCRSGRSGNIGGFGFSGQIEKLDEPNNSQIGDRGRNDLIESGQIQLLPPKNLPIAPIRAKNLPIRQIPRFGRALRDFQEFRAKLAGFLDEVRHSQIANLAMIDPVLFGLFEPLALTPHYACLLDCPQSSRSLTRTDTVFCCCWAWVRLPTKSNDPIKIWHRTSGLF